MRILLTASSILLVGGCHAFQPTTCPPSFRRAATTSSLESKSKMEMVASSSINLPDTSRPLAPHTFAGMVEQGLLERFDESQITRVLQSWRLLDQEYYHNVYVGDPSLQETSHMIQECHSYVPGLPIQSFWNPEDDFNWAKALEDSYPEIAAEFQAVTADLQTLQKQGNNIWAGALTEDASAYGQDWKTLVLMNRGTWDPVNVNLFPKTSSAVQKAGVPVTEVFFASMKGPSKIERHTDFTNFVLTSHLAIDIPCNGQNKCRLTVGDTTNEWINGKCMVFDTSLLHDAVNESDEMRYILMMRIWHPDLTPVEREALQFTYDCLEVPGLVSLDAGERFMAERTVEIMRSFPALEEKPAVVQGFGTKKRKEKNNKSGSKSKGFGI
jgi:aspartyl/asparaginyl beta-hydroxylase (cupin superfamily)